MSVENPIGVDPMITCLPHLDRCARRCLAFLAIVMLLACLASAAPGAEEEFVGPFASWLDVRRDFGAAGDGKTDDTPALQRALDEIREHKRASVLYLPAGTYRITQTLTTARKAHQDNMVTVVGEDPASVVLRWDGPEGGTMFQWDAWYAKLSRLTFDGAGRAETCLRYGPHFSTYNETSDLVLRDAKYGIVFGGPDSAGQAENEVLRCRFLRCGVGIQTVNWNSMDIWVWYCRFEDCGRGIHNVMGNWHAWENLFLRSKISDVSLMNLMAFSVVNNTSVGSKRFLDFSSGHTWGSPTSITGNRVLDPTGDWAMILDNAGPYLVVDNVMRLGNAARGVRMTWADQTLLGNVYSKDDAVEERGRFRRIDEKVVAASDIPDALPTLPPAAAAPPAPGVRPSRDRRRGGHPAGDRSGGPTGGPAPGGPSADGGLQDRPHAGHPPRMRRAACGRRGQRDRHAAGLGRPGRRRAAAHRRPQPGDDSRPADPGRRVVGHAGGNARPARCEDLRRPAQHQRPDRADPRPDCRLASDRLRADATPVPRPARQRQPRHLGGGRRPRQRGRQGRRSACSPGLPARPPASTTSARAAGSWSAACTTSGVPTRSTACT